MHPVIRIVTFLVFGVFVALGNVADLGLAFVLVSTVYLAGHIYLLPENWRMLKRMRWLFLSILIIYLWFTPGQALFPSLASWSPSIPGTQHGVLRITSLVLIVLGVNLLVKTVSHEKLTAALIWLLTPLRWLGLPHQKLAIRMSLTFSLISEVQYLHELMKKNQNEDSDRARFANNSRNVKPSLMQRLDAIGTYAADLLQAVLDKSLAMPSREVTLEDQSTPPVYQWGYPAMLVAAFWVNDSLVSGLLM